MVTIMIAIPLMPDLEIPRIKAALRARIHVVVGRCSGMPSVIRGGLADYKQKYPKK
jgi:hypothetical protein